MKKILISLLALLLLLTSCNTAGTTDETTDSNTTDEIVDTTEESTTEEVVETDPQISPLSIYQNQETSYQLVYNEDSASSASAAGLVHKLTALGFNPMRTKSDYAKKDTPEIIIGDTRRPESVEVLASLPENSYTITIMNDSLVIVGTDATLTALALFKFEETVLSNPERCKDGNLTVTAEDILTVTDDTVYTLRDMIAAGYHITATSKKIGTAYSALGCSIGQGACSDGTYVYLCLRNSDDSASVISKHEIATGKRVMISQHLDLGHANDATFDTKNNRIVVAHGLSEGKILSLIDPETLELIEDVNISVGSGAITYNAEKDLYAISQGGKTIHILSGDFTLLHSYTRTDSTGYTSQGMGSDNDYLYFPLSGKQDNILVVYTWDAQYVTTITIPMKSESESLFWVNDTYYIAYNVGGEAFYETTFYLVYE